jgi:Predicted acyltransferase
MSGNGHWSDSQEVVSTNRPLKFTLLLIKFLPAFLVHLIVFPVSFFFYLGAKSARKHVENFQKQMQLYTNGETPKKINSYLTILSFALSVVEKMEGWLGKTKYKNLIKHDDDLQDLISLLESGKGAYLIGSHLGNIELMRSLSSFCETGVSKKISVTTIMSMKVTSQFNNTLKEINPEVVTNVIDPDSIGPETIFALQNEVENGGLVVITGDRTSAHNGKRFIEREFLGRTAEFPYGVFLIASLLKAPVFFVFGIRTKSAALFPKNNMFVEKAKTDFNCSRAETKKRIEKLCGEYVTTLEKYCIKYPNQWYNFFDFWQKNGGENG